MFITEISYSIVTEVLQCCYNMFRRDVNYRYILLYHYRDVTTCSIEMSLSITTEILQKFYSNVHYRSYTEMSCPIVTEMLQQDILLCHYRSYTEVLQQDVLLYRYRSSTVMFTMVISCSIVTEMLQKFCSDVLQCYLVLLLLRCLSIITEVTRRCST